EPRHYRLRHRRQVPRRGGDPRRDRRCGRTVRGEARSCGRRVAAARLAAWPAGRRGEADDTAAGAGGDARAEGEVAGYRQPEAAAAGDAAVALRLPLAAAGHGDGRRLSPLVRIAQAEAEQRITRELPRVLPGEERTLREAAEVSLDRRDARRGAGMAAAHLVAEIVAVFAVALAGKRRHHAFVCGGDCDIAALIIRYHPERRQAAAVEADGEALIADRIEIQPLPEIDAVGQIEIAEGIGNALRAEALDRLDDMGVMADHEIDPGVEGAARPGAVGGKRQRRELVAPMHDGDQQRSRMAAACFLQAA